MCCTIAQAGLFNYPRTCLGLHFPTTNPGSPILGSEGKGGDEGGGLREGCQLVGPSEACISCGAVGELSCGGGGGDGSFY